MKILLVGGAVRDKFLGIDSQDKDYLVLDATHEEMKSLGFVQVGSNFPIYLHPITKDEYAFPRGTSLEEDLYRRDLTINSMAIDTDGNLIDPYNGLTDLHQKILRHTSEAFADDPFRVYRVMRFKARFPEFTIASETIEFMRKIVLTENFQKQDPERMIKELRIVLSLPRPSLFFEGLRSLKALSPFFSELEVLISEGQRWDHTMSVLDNAARLSEDPIFRFASLVIDLGTGARALGERILAPNDWIEAATVVSRFHSQIQHIHELQPRALVEMFYQIDAFRKSYLIEVLAFVSKADLLSGTYHNQSNDVLLRKYFTTAQAVTSKDVSRALTGKAIGEAIKELRISRLSNPD